MSINLLAIVIIMLVIEPVHFLYSDLLYTFINLCSIKLFGVGTKTIF